MWPSFLGNKDVKNYECLSDLFDKLSSLRCIHLICEGVPKAHKAVVIESRQAMNFQRTYSTVVKLTIV